MRRIVVVGGTGFFGSAVTDLLRSEGAKPIVAARRQPADLTLDVEDHSSIRAALRPGDVVVDSVGPFQGRTTTLVEAAIETGFGLVDLADSLDYVEQVYELEGKIAASGVRILTACSSISAASAALLQLSGVTKPVRVTGFLVPAARHVVWPGTGGSLLGSVGRPIRTRRDGQLVSKPGWGESRDLALPAPLGRVRGYLFESADALTLSRVWPELRTVDFFVHSNVPGFDTVFRVAAHWSLFRKLVVRLAPVGLAAARRIGGTVGGLTYEIEDESGSKARLGLIGADRGYLTPAAPAVMAARNIAEDRFQERGLVRADQQVEPEKLIAYLRTLGVELVRMDGPVSSH